TAEPGRAPQSLRLSTLARLTATRGWTHQPQTRVPPLSRGTTDLAAAQAQTGGSSPPWSAGADVEARRSLEHGLNAGCAQRWAPLSHTQCAGSHPPRVLGAGGRYLVAWSAGDPPARPARRMAWRAQADHRRQWSRVCRADLGCLGLRARRHI